MLRLLVLNIYRFVDKTRRFCFLVADSWEQSAISYQQSVFHRKNLLLLQDRLVRLAGYWMLLLLFHYGNRFAFNCKMHTIG